MEGEGRVNVIRRLLLSGTVAMVGVGMLGSGPVLAQAKGGVINVATVGEPPTLDPMVSTADLVGIITQHFFETLFTFDKNWKVTPLLAEAMPDISADGKVYTIKLRQGVTFHDGSTMTSADVVASLKRWMEVASRGKQTAGFVESVEAVDGSTVKLTLKSPYAPLLALLAFNNAAAVIMPAGKMENPLKEPVGTGPYRLKERKADQYIQLVRHDGYKSRAGEPDGYGGARKQLLDEIRFVPVPDPNTRIEGAISGQYDYVDALPVEAFDRLKGKSTTQPILLKPFGWPVFVMNTKQGVMSNLDARLAVRTALSEEDMLTAAFGSKDFFALNAAMFPSSYIWHTTAGTENAYNLAAPDKAKELLKKASYDGKPLRILTSRQYEFHYKMAQVAAEYLKQGGFAVELMVVDWATLTQRRTDPALWDIYITHSPFLPEPALTGILSEASPGWWTTPLRKKVVDAFNSEPDPAKRPALWAEVQKAIYAEVPAIKIGDFNALSAQAPKVKGVDPAPWPYFWNASVQ
jgi:peptide/nickel transport system substrate-binding protein